MDLAPHREYWTWELVPCCGLSTHSQLPSATLGMHALGLGVAIIEHAFIVVFIQVRLRQLKRAAVAV